MEQPNDLLMIYFLSNYLQNRLVTILGEQLLESWKFDKKIQTGDIETKKNKDTNSLKLKSMALFGATPSQDMQLSRFASELASGKIRQKLLLNFILFEALIYRLILMAGRI